MKQMTYASAKRKLHLALGIQSGLAKVDYYPRLRLGQYSAVSRQS